MRTKETFLSVIYYETDSLGIESGQKSFRKTFSSAREALEYAENNLPNHWIIDEIRIRVL